MKKALLLPVSLMILAQSGSTFAQTQSGGVQSSRPLASQYDALDDSFRDPRYATRIGERELLKRYLDLLAKDSKREGEQELERIALQRDIFNSYNQRWWAQYGDAERDRQVERYWNTYRSGSRYADAIMSSAAGSNACRVLTSVVDGGKALPPEVGSSSSDPTTSEAFRRGVVAAYPACFIADLMKPLREFDAEVTSLRKSLFQFKRSVEAHRPDEAEIDAIYSQLASGFASGLESLVTGETTELSSVIQVRQAKLDSVKRLATTIATAIDCDHLKSRRGRQMSCTIGVIPAPYEVNRDAAFKILLGGQLPGVYQTDLRMTSFFEAVDTYLREVRPDDILVRGLTDQLNATLTSIDREGSASFQSYMARFEQKRTDFVRNVSLANKNVWRAYFPDDVRQRLLDTFYSIKERLEAYERLDLSTQAESELLAKIVREYSEALASAGATTLWIQLPKRPIQIDLGDETKSSISMGTLPGRIPAGFLLGQSEREVSVWMSELAYQNQ